MVLPRSLVRQKGVALVVSGSVGQHWTIKFRPATPDMNR